jgi:AsmA-like C-terminal region
LAIDSLIWNDAQVTNLRGPFWADDSICLVGQGATAKLGQPPRRLTADAYGGTLASDIQLQHQGHPSYHVDVSAGGVDLRRITSERLGGPRDLTGTVSGKLSLDGAGKSTYALAGAGELHIVDANIYKLPVLVALLKVLSNRSPDTTAFDRCDAQFDIHGEQIHFAHLNLLGDALSLYGRGDTSFDRNLNLEFYSMVGPGGFTLPLLSSMAGQASKQILQLKVDGSIDNPQIHREAFPAVNQVLQQIQAELQPATPMGVVAPVAPVAPAAVEASSTSSAWAPLRK